MNPINPAAMPHTTSAALISMSLRDFVIVESLDIDFAMGYTALTGETGAGKSILIDALQLALGERAHASCIREGATRCDISAAFLPSAAASDWLSQAGIDAKDGLILRRSIDQDGKSRAWINGTLSTLSQVRELAALLVDIHGQHAWQSLTQAASQRRILDDFAGLDCQEIETLWQQWHQAKQQLSAAKDNLAHIQERCEALNWKIAEVEKLAPKEGEWSQLNTEHTRLSHIQSILSNAASALQLLDGGEYSVYTSLHRAHNLLQQHSHLEPLFAQWAQNVSTALALVQDTSRSLGHYHDKTEVDEQGLQTLDERLSLWMSLARRYRVLPEELPSELAHWRDELASLEKSTNIRLLEQHVNQAYEAYLQAARQLSLARKKAAPILSARITESMQTLGMPGGVFSVRLIDEAAPSSFGLENVEFLVAGHPGVSPKPVGKIASGGELSRIALALAVTSSQMGQAPTLIFDEVDSGIGGATAITVGKLLRQLASPDSKGAARQVLAVTHLPQVAAHAHHHLLVSKTTHPNIESTRSSSDNIKVLSTITPLDETARVEEIARMLGGKLSETTLQHAQEMLHAAHT